MPTIEQIADAFLAWDKARKGVKTLEVSLQAEESRDPASKLAGYLRGLLEGQREDANRLMQRALALQTEYRDAKEGDSAASEGQEHARE